MTEQLHRRFSTEEVKVLLQKYLDEKVKLTYIVEILNITRRRFFQLLRDYKEDPDNFSIQYRRKRATRKITEDVEKNIVNEGEEVFIQRIHATFSLQVNKGHFLSESKKKGRSIS